MEHNSEKQFYSIKEVARIVGFTEQTIYDYVLAGRIKAKKIGSRWRISEQDLKTFINGGEADAGVKKTCRDADR